MKPTFTRRNSVFAVVVIAIAIVVTACSSGSSTTTTTTTPKNLSVNTPDGQVSLSLDGQLPPNWPSGFPVPSGVTPAGSGSLGNEANTTLVGVYRTSAAPSATFDFYKNNPSLTTSSVMTLGAGSTFVGTLKMTEPQVGSVTVAGEGTNTLIIVVLHTPGASSTSTSSTSTTLSGTGTSAVQP